MVAANKVDDPADEPLAAAFFRLGLGEPQSLVGASRARVGRLPPDPRGRALPEVDRSSDDAWGAVAIVGRPNVGKSSILNALTGEERSLVDSTSGDDQRPGRLPRSSWTMGGHSGSSTRRGCAGRSRSRIRSSTSACFARAGRSPVSMSRCW